jgi:hypothetical protein
MFSMKAPHRIAMPVWKDSVCDQGEKLNRLNVASRDRNFVKLWQNYGRLLAALQGFKFDFDPCSVMLLWLQGGPRVRKYELLLVIVN